MMMMMMKMVMVIVMIVMMMMMTQASQTHDSKNRSNIYDLASVLSETCLPYARCCVTHWAAEILSAPQGIVWNLKQSATYRMGAQSGERVVFLKEIFDCAPVW